LIYARTGFLAIRLRFIFFYSGFCWKFRTQFNFNRKY